VIRANDKRRTRLEAIRSVLYALDYDGKTEALVGKPDAPIVGSRPDLFYGTGQT
jgi:polyphosphate kinase